MCVYREWNALLLAEEAARKSDALASHTRPCTLLYVCVFVTRFQLIFTYISTYVITYTSTNITIISSNRNLQCFFRIATSAQQSQSAPYVHLRCCPTPPHEMFDTWRSRRPRRSERAIFELIQSLFGSQMRSKHCQCRVNNDGGIA